MDRVASVTILKDAASRLSAGVEVLTGIKGNEVSGIGAITAIIQWNAGSRLPICRLQFNERFENWSMSY